MARLPKNGADTDNWGTVLNEYLEVSHSPEGTLKTDTVGSPQIKPLAVTNSNIANETISEEKLAPDVQAKLNTTTSTTGTGQSPLRAINILRAALSRRLSSTPVVLVFAGSSSTQGKGASVESRRYVNRFVAHLKAAYPPLTGSYTSAIQTLAQANLNKPSGSGVFAVNAGIVSTRSNTYLTSTTRAQIASLKPQAIIHMIGANDFGNGVSVAAYKANLISQISALDTAITGQHVHLFLHTYARFDKAAQTAKVAEWSDYLAALYEIQLQFPKTVAVIDTSDEWSAVGVTGAPSVDSMDLISADDIHMNDYGHEYMADLLRLKVLNAMGAPVPAATPEPPVEPSAFTNTYTSDSFVRSDDGIVTGSYTDTYDGGESIAWQSSSAAWNTVDGSLLATPISGSSMLPITSSDYEISAIVKTMTSATSTTLFSIDGRRSSLSAAGASQYRLRCTSNGALQLSKYVNGTETGLWASSANQIAFSDKIALRLDGNTISVRKNNVELGSVIDTSVPSSAFCGLSHSANITGAWASVKVTLK